MFGQLGNLTHHILFFSSKKEVDGGHNLASAEVMGTLDVTFHYGAARANCLL